MVECDVGGRGSVTTLCRGAAMVECDTGGRGRTHRVVPKVESIETKRTKEHGEHHRNPELVQAAQPTNRVGCDCIVVGV